MSVRHYINKEFAAREARIEKAEEERDTAIRERDNANTEKTAAESKWEAEKARRQQAAQDAQDAEADKAVLEQTVAEGEKRIARLRKELDDAKYSNPEPDPVSGNDVANAQGLSDLYNCYILYGNSGQVAECN